MPCRRKNAELGRSKRSSRKSKFCEYLSSAYIQYIVIFMIWGILLFVNQSTEMRFEYFWPGWLFMCSIHDSFKFQGLQYTVVFILIVLTMDTICYFLFPASWIYSCGSAYVWVYLLWHTDQGLCFLTLTLCFIFVYFELGFYSRETKFNQSIYLFRPFAAHSIGYPVVCMGYSIKRYFDSRQRKFKKMDVRRRNLLYYRILREAIPYITLSDPTSGGSPSLYLPDDVADTVDWDYDSSTDGSGNPLPWSVFLLQQLGKSLCSQVNRLTSCSAFLSKECNSVSSHHTCQSLQRHVGTNSNSSHITANGQPASTACPVALSETAVRHVAIGHSDAPTSGQGSRRCTADCTPSDGTQIRSKQPSAANKPSGRFIKEDLNTRLENSVRRLRGEVQSMRAVESQLRDQLAQLELKDHSNRLQLSDQLERNEALALDVKKLLGQSRLERSNLQLVEQTLIEEQQLRQSLETQLSVDATKELNCSSIGSSTHGPPGPSSKDDLLSLNDHDSGVVDFIPSETVFVEAPCCHRRRGMESEVYSLRLNVKRHEDQIRVLSGARARHANHHQHSQRSSNVNTKFDSHDSDRERLKRHGSERSEDESAVEVRVQRAMLEAEQLSNRLRQENWMKQELLTSYHNSVREINDLNKTHKQRDLQILELTMKIEQLECFALSHSDRNCTGQPKRDLIHGVRNGGSVGDKSAIDCGVTSLTSVLNSTPLSSPTWNATSCLYGSGRFGSEPPNYHSFHPTSDALRSKQSHAVTTSYATIPNGVGGENNTQFNSTVSCDSSTHFPYNLENTCSDVLSTSSHIRSGPVGCLPRISTETH